jgi:hypothetical protein
MTEEEWFEWSNPWSFLVSVQTPFASVDAKLSDRKLRLFAVACCRSVRRRWRGKIIRAAVEAAEKCADIAPSSERRLLRPFRKIACDNYRTNPIETHLVSSVSAIDCLEAARSSCYMAASYSTVDDDRKREQEQIKRGPLLRDIFGNPCRPVTFASAWRTSTTVALAESMYAARDFGNMPILADALEEAGCDNAEVLSHCRGNGPHVRGCWVVDLVLGKS